MYVVYQKSVINDFVVGIFMFDFDAYEFVKLKSYEENMYVVEVTRPELNIIIEDMV